MENVLKELVGRLTKALPAELVSVVLYGSAAVGDHHGRYSDINILCVLNRLERAQLQAAAGVFHWWHELGNPSPLLMTQDELRSSTDCFPIEFHDIRERHRILHGADLVADLEIDDGFYRAQVEHELRSKLFRLRQKAAEILAERDLMRTLLSDSLSTFAVLFRHALRVHGIPAGFPKREVVAEAHKVFGIEEGPFLRILEMREGKLKPRDVDPVPLFDIYWTEIQKVIEAVDRLER